MTETSDQPVAEETHVSDAAGVADEAHAQGDQHDTGTGDADNLDEDGNLIEPDQAQDDDHEEIDHDGEKYKVPKKLKEAFLRQSDYTKKTQELADQRKGLEGRQSAWDQERTQQTEAVKALRADIGVVARLSHALEEYKGVDWVGAQTEIARIAADPAQQAEAFRLQAQYNTAWHKFTALERDLNQAQSSLQEKEQTFAREQTQRVQAQQREAFATLEKDIPGFNQDVLRSIVDHGVKAFGLRPEEAQQLADPRVWKLLHSDQSKTAEITALKAEVAKLKGQRTAQANNEAAQQVRPATRIGGNAPANGAPRDSDDIETWMRKENARLARKQARR